MSSTIRLYHPLPYAEGDPVLFLAGIGLVLLYPVSLFCWNLWIAQRAPEEYVRSSAFRRQHRHLFTKYRHGYIWFELVHMLRALLAVVSIALCTGQPGAH